MKKKVLIIISIIIALVLIIFIGTGLTKKSNVVIKKFSVNEDGSELTFTVVIHSSIGTKSEYVLQLDEDDTEFF